MLYRLYEFFTLQDPNAVWVLSGIVLLGIGCGVIGCFTFLTRKSLAGDALAHAALPGVTSAYLIFVSRDPLVILGGAFVSCLLGWGVIYILTHYTKIKEDAALALVLSVFFALGAFQLSFIQRMESASQAGLDKLLFGQAASITASSVWILLIGTSVVLFCVWLCFGRLRLIAFDRTFARAAGIRVASYETLLALLLVLSIVVGLELVGVVLMAAVLLTSPSAARYWTDHLPSMLGLSALFGAVSGVFGATVSYLFEGMPTGPWMVIGLTGLFACSVIFGKQRGILWRELRYARAGRKVNDENILRTLYKIGEPEKAFAAFIEPSTIVRFRNIKQHDMFAALRRLVSRNLVRENSGAFALSESGLKEAARVTRLHRLWELYLTNQIGIMPDHVHADAEEIEHVLNPELEAILVNELNIGSEDIDPHGKEIPK